MPYESRLPPHPVCRTVHTRHPPPLSFETKTRIDDTAVPRRCSPYRLWNIQLQEKIPDATEF